MASWINSQVIPCQNGALCTRCLCASGELLSQDQVPLKLTFFDRSTNRLVDNHRCSCMIFCAQTQRKVGAFESYRKAGKFHMNLDPEEDNFQVADLVDVQRRKWTSWDTFGHPLSGWTSFYHIWTSWDLQIHSDPFGLSHETKLSCESDHQIAVAPDFDESCIFSFQASSRDKKWQAVEVFTVIQWHLTPRSPSWSSLNWLEDIWPLVILGYVSNCNKTIHFFTLH